MKTFNCDGYEVPWTFWRKVKKFCCGDEMRCIDAFWKTHKAIERAKAEGREVGAKPFERYIQAGLVEKDGKRYILMPSQEMETPQGKAKIMAWWKSQYEDKPGPSPIRAELKRYLAEMAEGL